MRYHQNLKPSNGQESAAVVTYRCLNKMTLNDEACRWFESEYVTTDKQRHERRKFLVPEETFEGSPRPTDRILRYLARDDDQAVVSLATDTQGWMILDVMHFPGLLKASTLDDVPRDVPFQRGTLSIPKAYAGTYKWWRKDKTPEATTVFESKYQVWMHPDLPTGFAHAKVRLGMSFQGKESRFYEVEWTLQDFGNDARPAIPEVTAPSQ